MDFILLKGEVIYMFAEVFSKGSNRKYNAFTVQFSDTEIVTTIPKLKEENICFLPDDTIFINIPMNNNNYIFETTFKSFKKMNSMFFFRFNILENQVTKNIRKELRKHTDNPAILNLPNRSEFSFANILDTSKNGMKIETEDFLHRRVLHVSFQNGLEKEVRRVKVAWHRKIGNKHQYGLETVS